MNNKSRPVNLDIQTIRFPIAAIASILHRVSGVITFFALAVLLSLLSKSLHSADGFAVVMGWLDSLPVKLVMWIILSVLAYHIVFGIRHVVMDFGYWEELQSGSASARGGFIVVAVIAVLMGILVW
ncbi:succinate dehydrogenase, cytochrome b556 subunit [Celerinatantimonas yamalensis]|uniref:Succinate dehydrogenase cytochrome b556 subunit n=1 Tax=Celerinatantimonas yamalensis TaxID=559956 RepID=A0ABW9G3U0_9GAMM